MTSLYVGLGLLLLALVLFFLLALWRTWKLDCKDCDSIVRGLGLPRGSIRGLIAFAVIGAFIILIFLGKDALTTETVLRDAAGVPLREPTGDPVVLGLPITEGSTELFTAVLTSLGTLTAAVSGFYFGGRSGETTPDSPGESNGTALSGADGGVDPEPEADLEEGAEPEPAT